MKKFFVNGAYIEKKLSWRGNKVVDVEVEKIIKMLQRSRSRNNLILKNGAEEIAGNKRLYTNITKIVKAKYDDIFQVNMDVKSKTTKKSDGSKATFEGELVFSEDKLNPGGPDRKVREEMKKWLEQDWSEELGEYLKKLMKLDIKRGQRIWSDSPGPIDRAMIIQQGLIAEGLVTAMGGLDKRSKRVSTVSYTHLTLPTKA